LHQIYQNSSVDRQSCQNAQNGKPARAKERNGTQAVDRALRLLYEIASDDGSGRRLTDLAASANLDAATVRRLLRSLVAHGFVEQDRTTRRYCLGIEFFTIAAAVSNRLDIDGTTRSMLGRLSRASGASAVFMVRAGYDLVCIDLARPNGDLVPRLMDMGSRRPIGSGAFGLAVLASLPLEERENIAIHNVRRFSPTPELAIRTLRDAILTAHRLGYAIEIDPVHDHANMAVAILNREGQPEAAIGLEGVRFIANDNLDTSGLARMLMSEARTLQEVLWRLPEAHRALPRLAALPSR
jgi:DNA-binding IclR family transcriptional regulator